MLIESGDDAKPYLWNILIYAAGDKRRSFHDGKDHRGLFQHEKTADVYRRNDGATRSRGTGIRRDWNRAILSIIPPTVWQSGGIGYGVAVEGKDDNGNELTFKLYIPLSGEIRPKLTRRILRKKPNRRKTGIYLH